ncbi:Plant transposase (Ptta/En/Spm family) [Carex littledalei]|uniref:Plant transposase (Ptta/En/Spm family) n=1 Tax=Carex littledalei TaxID=544730 RepID=A0A833REU6_9POAL|nr:Plant transposase (Ptta/En/Spm family) [Carex littledalei]
MDNSDDAEGYVISVRWVSARLRANVEVSDTGRVTRSSSRKPLPPPQENKAEEHPSSSVRIGTYFGPNPYLSAPQPQTQPQPPPQPQPEPQPDNETADNTFKWNTAQDADNFDPLFTYTAADTPQFSEDSDSMEDADNDPVNASADSPLPTSEPESSSQPNSAATQPSSDTTVPSAEPDNLGGSGTEIPVLDDDGSRRFHRCRTLRSCPEANEASGKDLDWSAATVQTNKRKRSGKGKKPDVKGVRGLAKPRGPTHPDSRPVLKVIGDAEFTSDAEDTKIVATIRLLTCECMPGPLRSFNMFPSRVRLQILFKFLQRYSWADGEDVGRCLDVFENIAAEAWYRVLNDTRRACNNKLGSNKELWKDFCPRWCKNVDHWKGLCDIWRNPRWEKNSEINRDNRTRDQFNKIAEKGVAVDLKEVFDRTHLKKSPAGKVYVSDKAKKTAELFQTLKVANGNEMDDEAIWNLAVKGEDKRGRVYGFGQKSRMSKANREVKAMEASPSEPTKSTATSAEMGKRFTAEEVEQLIAAQETRHRAEMDNNRKGFAQDIAAQEARHRAEMDENRKQNEYNRACLKALFAKTGAEPPNFSEFTSNVQDSGVGEGDTGGGGGDIGGGGEPNNGK